MIVFDEKGEAYFRPHDIAKQLEYSILRKGIYQILNRNEEYFEGKIKESPGQHGVDRVRYLSGEGLYLFLMFSQQPKANEQPVFSSADPTN